MSTRDTPAPDALQPGATLSHYRIAARLGAGGMGIVYRARDTRLGRDVAIKVINPDVAADPDRIARFHHEARTVAALNHSGIVTIHDTGEEHGTTYLVTELVDGRTVRTLLDREGRLGLRRVIEIGAQVADALAAAHGAGITHRDVKPENIMLTPSGRAKLLDFGLAQSHGSERDDGDTRTAVRTVADAVAGTIGYMSPEQIRGAVLDARSDIFSLGVVLYEMAGGSRPFRGGTSADVSSAVLQADPPPLSEASVPATLAAIIERCLQKEPHDRFQSASDLAFALRSLAARSSAAQVVEGPARSTRARGWLAAGLIAMAVGLGLVLTWAVFMRDRTAVPPPLEVVPLTSDAGNEESPSFSPDGSQVAYSWDGNDRDNVDIYVRLIGAPGRLRLTTDPAEDRNPIFSPDGRWIGFVRLSHGRWTYIVIPAIGGTERVVAQLPEEPASPMTTYGSIWSSAWLPDGKSIVLNGLRLLSLETGGLREVTTASGARVTGWFPAVSPDGRTMAFARPAAMASFDLHALTLSKDGAFADEPRHVANVDGDLWGLTWTADSRDLVFASGRLSGTSGTLKVLWRVAAAGGGRPEQVRAGDDVTAPAISRRGDRLVFVRSTLDLDLWRVTPGQDGQRPERFAYSTRSEWNPQYSPDGRRVAFESNRTGESAIWVSAADGSDLLEVFSRPGRHAGTPRWSPDSQRLAFDSSAAGNFDVYVIQPGSAQALQLTTDAADDAVPSWSPDGRWVYFFSNRTGRQEIWKVPAGGGPAIQVTQNGGACVFPSADGIDIYYTKLDAGSALWSMPVTGGAEREVLPSVIKRNFVVVEDGIYFMPAVGPGGGFGVHFLDFSTGAVQHVATLDSEPGYGFTVSPDRRHILYSQIDRAGRDLMLVDGFR